LGCDSDYWKLAYLLAAFSCPYATVCESVHSLGVVSYIVLIFWLAFSTSLKADFCSRVSTERVMKA